MRWGKKTLALAVMVALVATPFISAGSNKKEMPVGVTIISPTGSAKKTVQILETDAQRIASKYEKAQEAVKIIKSSSNEDEKNKAIQIIEDFLNELVKLGILPANFVASFIPNFLNPKFDLMPPLISFGSGFSYIPLYPGEAFLGFMFRPIIIQYFLLGYTASLSFHLLPPRIEYWDMVGTQTMIICGFVGAYIDFGKIGYGIPNAQFIMGASLLTIGIDWL
ncbi:MAG: hypothetical protein QXF32_03285 [Candidatus Thermoplasmatota archaeon]